MDNALKGWKYFRKHFPSLTGYDGMIILEQISCTTLISGMYRGAKSDLLVKTRKHRILREIEHRGIKPTEDLFLAEVHNETIESLDHIAGFPYITDVTLKHFWGWDPLEDYKPLQDGYNHDPRIQKLFKKRKKNGH